MTHTALLAIDDLNFEADVLGAKRPFLLTCGGAWCAPCQRLLPILERLAAAHGDRVAFGKLDTDEAALSAARLQVRGVPTLILFEAGREVARRVGAASEATLLQWLVQHGRGLAAGPARPPLFGAA
jgi:thioredoxin-like negative regulator of GroEL